MAREPDGSTFLGMKAVDGRTASPLRIDHSLMFERRKSLWPSLRWGGYSACRDVAMDQHFDQTQQYVLQLSKGVRHCM